MSTNRKRHQIVMLRQRILDAKMLFNTLVMTLRAGKETAIGRLAVLRSRAEVVTAALGVSKAALPAVPVMDDEELPQRKSKRVLTQ